MITLLLDEADPRAPAAFSFYYLANVGSARTYGAELSARFLPTGWWSLSASMGWLHARMAGGLSYGSYVGNQLLPDTRTWTTNIRSEMAYPITPTHNLLFSVNWHHEAGGALDITDMPWHSLDRLDLTLGTTWKKNQLVVFANNTFNNRVVDYALTDGMYILTPPATYGARFTAAF
ncbi:TonB-dependent receptor domain-containing protein [Komagataeibacter intermedius]|uniref:TonB-dependent receptor domain-containing protein n=1 Tax=Komagataeibacter intermedius TaxID=66229 RepID=UPI003B42A463